MLREININYRRVKHIKKTGLEFRYRSLELTRNNLQNVVNIDMDKITGTEDNGHQVKVAVNPLWLSVLVFPFPENGSNGSSDFLVEEPEKGSPPPELAKGSFSPN